MTPHWEQSVLDRSGDAVWRIALLCFDDRTTAERAVRFAFVHALGAAHVEQELYRQLLAYKPRRRLLLRHVLPRPLRRIASQDRALLGLWLLHGYDAARLGAVSSLASSTITERLAQALPVAADQQIEDADRRSMEAWLRGQLGLDLATEQGRGAIRWHVLVAAARQHLREAVGRERLPGAVADGIERDLEARAAGEERHWWQQRAVVVVGVIAAVALVLLLLAEPWKRGAPTAAAPPPTPRELVASAIGRWDDTAADGTLHRRVVAVDPRMSSDEPLTVEVWLGSQNGKHRVEVRRGDELVEWQIGDGRSRLLYAANPRWSSCPWPNSVIVDNHPRSFTLRPQQQAAVRDERLTLGAYGTGYRALQSALDADDLRSFGARRDGERPTLTLGFTDRQTTPARRLLLLIDTATGELRRVQQVIDGGAQGSTRDLWRVEVDEQTNRGVSLQQPPSDRETLDRDRLLDPSCPALDDRFVISLRTQTALRWWRAVPYLPTRLPPGITRAAIVSMNGTTDDVYQPVSNATLLMIGPQRSISLTQMPDAMLSSDDLEQQGQWRVRIEDRDGVTEGELCRAETDDGQCYNSLMMVARGWGRDDLLALIDTLEPTSIDTWLALDNAFLDPQPLSAEVKAVFQASFDAIEPRPGQTIHSVTDRWQRIDPNRPRWNDPYHVPLDISVPERVRDEQWIAYDGGSERFSTTRTLPDGTVLSAQIVDGITTRSYSATSGSVNVRKTQEAWWYQPQPSPPTDMLMNMLQSPLPIRQTQTDQAVVLEQRDLNLPQMEQWFAGWQPGVVEHLPAGTFVRRVVIDRATNVPRRAELVHVADDGSETPLHRADLTMWRADEAPPTTVWSLPALPAETVTFIDQQNLPPAIETTLDFSPPQRVLAWPETTTIRVESQSRPIRPNTRTSQQLALARAWNNPLDRLDGGGIIDVTRYRMEGQPARVTIRQGSRDLLRHLLRYQWQSEPEQWTRTRSSEPVTAMIAGQVRNGWRIGEGTNQALIFEIDNLLLHVSGVAQALGPVLAQLPSLEWQDVGDRAP